ncbi:MAG: hypothetical protein JSS32_06545 [Verrucomicrobia bacterium]|nr:hypothetical protein [Verrucomicrobiota bacterium]
MNSIDSLDIGWDRTCLNISSHLAQPICELSRGFIRVITPLKTDEFENYPSLWKEVAFRAGLVFSGVLMACLLPLTLAVGLITGLGSKLFKAIGYSLQKDGYTHIRGKADEAPIVGKATYFDLNACAAAGGFSITHGGPIDWRLRVDWILEEIRRKQPGTIVLQEIYDTDACEWIVKALENEYAHFFTHLGPTVWGSEGGCMVITKHAYSHFSHTMFSNTDWTLRRGYAILELKATPDADKPIQRIVGTHLHHGSAEESAEKREIQFGEIREGVRARPDVIQTFLTGDLNIELKSDEAQNTFASTLIHHYDGKLPTCTSTLAAKWDPKYTNTPPETIDYFSEFAEGLGLPVQLAKGVTCERISMYTPGNTQKARSDHDALYAEVPVAG